MSATADYLREAREQRELTLAQVEEATRIPRHYLEILEGGGDNRLVSDRLYMLHFLRKYAAFLEIEEETLAARFVGENRREPDVAVPLREPRSWKVPAVVVLAVLLTIGAGVYLYDPTLLDIGGGPVEQSGVETASAPDPEPTPPPETAPQEAPAQRPSPAAVTPAEAAETESSVLQPEANETAPTEPRLVAVPPAPEPAPAPETAAVTATEETLAGGGDASETAAANPSNAVQEPAGPDQASGASETTTATPSSGDAGLLEHRDTATAAIPGGDAGPSATAAAAPAIVASAAPDPDAAANHSLIITATEEAWLRVWVDGEPPRDMLLDPGAVRTLSAQAGFVITFGNAGGVTLTLNGEEVPAAGSSGEVVRGFRLPSDG